MDKFHVIAPYLLPIVLIIVGAIVINVVVIAVGVRPNTELVAQAGGKVSRGIAASDCGETSLPDIYAAGDCCESYDITTGQNRILALLPNAYMQGEAAGIAACPRLFRAAYEYGRKL